LKYRELSYSVDYKSAEFFCFWE